VNSGGTIKLYVSTTAPSYTLEIYRMGFEGGRGGRRVYGPSTRPGHLQPNPTPDADGLADCNWAFPVNISTVGWKSAPYLAKLTESATGTQRYIFFVVRDDADTSADFLFQCSVSTYQAYNEWPVNGGAGYTPSLYTTIGSPAHLGYKVSFNRPYDSGHPYWDGYGAGQFLQWELSIIYFLQSRGYSLVFTTDVAQHQDGLGVLADAAIMKHRCFIGAGHDEYWSLEQRNLLVYATEHGVNYIDLAGNAIYWQVRYEPDAEGTPFRTQVCYKLDAPTKDPLRGTPQETYQFGLADTGRPALPEHEILGTDYDGGKPDPNLQPLIVYNAAHRFFSGTGLSDGDSIGQFVGYECNTVTTSDGIPPPALVTLRAWFGNTNAELLCHSSPTEVGGGNTTSDVVVVYDQGGSGSVTVEFATMGVGFGLASIGTQCVPDTNEHQYTLGGTVVFSPRSPISLSLQKMVENVCNELKNPPLLYTDPTLVPGLVSWCLADHCGNSGGLVTTFPDGSGGAHGYAAAAGHQPAFVAADANWGGRPSINIAASNTYLDATDPSSEYKFTSDGSDFTMIIVCRPSSAGSGTIGTLWATTPNTTTGIGWRVAYNYTSQKWRVEMINGASGSASMSFAPANGSTPVDTNQIFLVRVSAALNVDGRLDASPPNPPLTVNATTDFTSAVPSSADPTAPPRMGARTSLGTADLFTGSVREVILFDRYLADWEIMNLYTHYLKAANGF
jgi:hypothetical protein